jgi:very-short-patch-repair endonuclease
MCVEGAHSPLSLWERVGVRAIVSTGYRGNRRGVTWPGLSRQLRRESTDAERRLWQFLRDRRLAGAKFRRQHEFGSYILDFFCAERNLAIEADGGQHYSDDGLADDAKRAQYLKAHGVRVLRFTNLEILHETEAVLERIRRAVE